MGHDLYNNLLESVLSQHVNKPTRDDNILDLIFSTNDSLVSNIIQALNSAPATIELYLFYINLKVYKDNVSEELIFIYCGRNFEKLRKFWHIGA